MELRYIGTGDAQTDCASMKCLRAGGQEKTHHAILCWLSNKRSALIAFVLRRPRFLPSYLEVRAFCFPTQTLVLVTFYFIGYHTGTQGRGNAFGTDTWSRKDTKTERGSRNTCAIKRGKARVGWTISAEDKCSLAILLCYCLKPFLVGVPHEGDFAMKVTSAAILVLILLIGLNTTSGFGNKQCMSSTTYDVIVSLIRGVSISLSL